MTLDDFMALTRLPTSAEMVSLCEEMGILILNDAQGQPVLRCKADAMEIGKAMAKLLGREPWRTQVIAARKLKDQPGPPVERPMQCRWRSGFEGLHSFPEQGWPVGAGWYRYVGESEWQPIPGREQERGGE